MQGSRYPALYQLNTRVFLTALSQSLGRAATLDDIADAELDRLSGMGFDWLWLLSVWQTGEAAQRISRSNPAWRREFEHTLPDLREEDIAGSGFAIKDYRVHRDLGGDAALARLRSRMRQRGLRLMLDFVPNHMALDHPWTDERPDCFVHASEADLARAPQNHCRLNTKNGPLLLAHGRDPYFDGWPDTLQLDYGNAHLQASMLAELERIAGQCDGVRCDMAMLIVPEVFERTWGIRAEAFWPRAIDTVRRSQSDFLFMAEIYWDMEWTLQQQGFDYAYDKRLYDRLHEQRARPVREHLCADMGYQDKLARFLENHDEPRAAAAFAPGVHPAAAVLTYLSPGLRFFHQGQFEGRRIRISPHLVRGPDEAVDGALERFYGHLLDVLRLPALRDGRWSLRDCLPAWDGNPSSDNFIAFDWEGADGERVLVAVNYAPQPSQCFVRLPFPQLAGSVLRLSDLLGTAVYDRPGDDLLSRGLFLDLPPWGHHAFDLQRIA
ncbi:alpha-amylase family glycosyl hydrolase [Variovorax ginsengisoli]|uniref:Alpha-amylase family glycosyl hydrolase n=1 Tax=Variovorax ginsengisoli TaxID=363844 RepID=A0ABT8S5J7_9BURK|nr:alpha-amylase family glycosyl hydrolase [Variovorax ginsengisoli]MDN8614910.1 alpha-amylase family glycosyl hydrolase [Variovorax ginsengisoli]MDO1534080.1 alpha-amylase family glycosyl hydrolase [Variovorax ginsengisoli]